MKTQYLYRSLLALSVCAYSLSACHDNELPAPADTPQVEVEAPDAWHDKIRTEPYPKAENELFINPSPLIVPEAMHTGETVQFALSQDSLFPEGEATQLSKPVKWNHFNPHRVLDPGTWYWRFRNLSAEGTAEAWSRTYLFEVKGSTPTFVTPPAVRFTNNLPVSYPRLYCFLDADKAAAGTSFNQHAEYKALIGRAKMGLDHDYMQYAQPHDFNATETIKPLVNQLYQAAYLTNAPTYIAKLTEIMRLMQAHLPIDDKLLFASNFGATNIGIIYAETYDICHSQLNGTERSVAEQTMMRILRHYYRMYCGMQENRIFDNHFWQHNLRIFVQMALLLHDHPHYGTECREMLEFYYELWTARAPASGFNRSGLWVNGVGYFTANVKTLFYMPMLFGHLTHSNFLRHPWYEQAGQSLVYAWAPGSQSSSFGDAAERNTTPDRQRVAFADFLARETGDGYAAWYAAQCAEMLRNDVDMRFYRMVSRKKYDGSELPVAAPKLVWYQDAGEVTIHSNLDDIEHNLSLGFRSSTFGANSHTLADQNAFRLLYGGENVFRSGGYFVGAANTPYNLLFYRHTRSQNSILVNGIGQAYSLKSYGEMKRAMGGDHIAYCMGDASHAYTGISDESQWVKLFADTKLEQSAENGFGATPLHKYQRHILVLYPRTVLIYDDIACTEPACIDWLLHSPTSFSISEDDGAVQLATSNLAKGFSTAVTQCANVDGQPSQTTRTPVPITPEPSDKYPDIWHLTNHYEASDVHRILTVIEVCPDGATPTPLVAIGTDNDGIHTYTYGGYTLHVALDADRPAELSVTGNEVKAQFSYSARNPEIDGGTYLRRSPYSSLLYDSEQGVYRVTEQMDYQSVTTRTGGK